MVTVARSDWGLYLPIARRIRDDPELRLQLIVSGAHLDPGFGSTAAEIEADGFELAQRVELPTEDDSPTGIAVAMGAAASGFGTAFARLRPDLLLVLGDRYEMHAAALAALPFRIPVAHVHGGESSEGAIDESLRHSITKLSHLHFASTELYARRIVQMGEEPWRVLVSGAPSLDNLRELDLLGPRELEERYGLRLAERTLLVTYHPVTLEYSETEAQVRELLAALGSSRMRVIFTSPNADTSGRAVARLIDEFVRSNESASLVPNFGTRAYLSLLGQVSAMVGNSSSGVIEAASFELPVVNVGRRQQGRLRPANVVDVGDRRAEILSGIEKAVSPAFRESLRGLENPYGDGRAAERIVARLKEVELGRRLIVKRFHDLPAKEAR